MMVLTSMVRRCPAGTGTDVVAKPPPSRPKTAVTTASEGPGFCTVRYSWNPGSVEPSAKVHDVSGAGWPTTVCEPFTRPLGRSRSKYIERSAAMLSGAVTRIDTPVRLNPITVGTSTVVRPPAGTLTGTVCGA